MKHLNARFVFAAAALTLPASVWSADGWTVTAGPVVRSQMEISVSGSSYTQTQGIHAATEFDAPPPGAGSASGFDNRTYKDGYVNIDPGTGDTSLPPGEQGLTWFWGYSNSSQYDPVAGTLAFVATNGDRRIRTVTQDEPLTGSVDEQALGASLSASRELFARGRFRLRLAAGFEGVQNGDTSLMSTSYSESYLRESYSQVDVYDVSLIPAAAFPAAGHAGTFAGPFDTPPVDPSPLIPNLPASRSVANVMPVGSFAATNSVSFDLDTEIYSLWIAPRLEMAVNEQLFLNLTPSISLSYTRLEVNRFERFTAPATGFSTTWEDSVNEHEWLAGLGLEAGAEVHTGPWTVGVYGGYKWMTGDVSVRAGPNTVAFDGDGATVRVEVGFDF